MTYNNFTPQQASNKLETKKPVSILKKFQAEIKNNTNFYNEQLDLCNKKIKQNNCTLSVYRRIQIVREALTANYINEIEKKVKVSHNTVTNTLSRFLEDGFYGIDRDKPRSGRKTVMTDTKVCIIHLSLTFVSPKEMMEEWSKAKAPKSSEQTEQQKSLNIFTSQKIDFQNKDIENMVYQAKEELIANLNELNQSDFIDLSISSTWDCKKLSLLLNINYITVWRYMRAHKINLSPKDSWCHSTDPLFTEKLQDIDFAFKDDSKAKYDVVLCFDEKTSMLAREYQIHQIHGSYKRSCRYKRHGTTNLIALLDRNNGFVYYKFMEKKDKKSILDFITEVIELPHFKDKRIAIVMDNLSTHKNWDRIYPSWYKEHSNVTCLFTPTNASWMNLVESFFGLLTKKVLKNASFKSIQELIDVCCVFIEQYNKKHHYYKWTLDIERLLNQRRHTFNSLRKLVVYFDSEHKKHNCINYN